MPKIDEADYWERRGMAQGDNDVAPQRLTLNPETNGITPASDTSGLYAIYGRRNPYSARASRLGALAGSDMGGRLGQLPGIVATVLTGKAEAKSQEFEQERDADIKAFMARKEAWDKIKNDRDARDYNANKVKEAMAVGQEAYFAALNSGKSFEEAPKVAKAAINDFATQYQVAMPPVENVHFWKGGDVSLIHSKEGGGTITLVKKGDSIAWKDGNEYKPVPKDAMGFGDLANITRAQTSASRSSTPEGMLEYYDANDNLVAKTKNQAEAIAAGAVTAGRWVKYIDQTGNEAWKMEKVPLSRAPKKAAGKMENTQVQGQPPAPAKAAQVNIQQNRPNPVPGSPGSGQAPAPVAHQPQNTEAQQAAAWIAANPNAPASQIAAIKAKYRLP